MSTSTVNRVHIGDLHNDHKLWLNTLEFCKQEIDILEHRMEEIVKRNTGKEVMAELEHFQNQYIRQREVIDELRHDLKQHENELVKEAMDHPVAIDHRLFGDHAEQRDAMHTFEKLYNELKAEFMRWLVKRM
ncbi:MAG: hypothetical protein IPH05_01905 [Flavobacteriales bacterium]|jgi:phosphoenolpyruvate carboxylase|nr:hypothetical protein [Flavobacteriales bacterium]MBK6550137.1 hypothetical protein [Flavobacteriales bacterium]MBK6881702.1 hypothetical protein [Flavobacteriales bacterium]MBK7102647.1 hypothetical protein [Flavobacteriales bacterium]MBK7113381.1 hypothetical protein [Flavobacteriales bacterium]